MNDKVKTKEKTPVLPDSDPTNRVWGIWDDRGEEEEKRNPLMPIFNTVEEADAWLKNRTMPKKK